MDGCHGNTESSDFVGVNLQVSIDHVIREPVERLWCVDDVILVASSALLQSAALHRSDSVQVVWVAGVPSFHLQEQVCVLRGEAV